MSLKSLFRTCIPFILAYNYSQAYAQETGVNGDRTDEQEKKALPENTLQTAPREISFNLGTIYTYENNDNVWSSLQQLLGKGSDELGVEKGWDENVGGRIGLTLASLYFSIGIQYYKHELAHEFSESAREFSIDFTSWGKSSILGLYPKYVAEKTPDMSFQEAKDKIITAKDGLNQDAYTAYTTWRRCALNRSCIFDDSTYFLVHKFFDLEYFISTYTSQDIDDNYGERKHQFYFDDVDGYLHALENENISLSKGEYLGQVLVADLASWHTWESIYSVFAYLVDGERTTKTTTIEAGAIKFTPPLISLYLTPKGGFYDTNTLFFYGGKSIQLSVGTDLDFAGGGELNTLRAGGEFNGVNISPLRISPFFYVNLERDSFGYKGLSAGIESFLGLTSSTSLSAKLEYNTNDVLENTIKLKEEGVNVVVGVDARF